MTLGWWTSQVHGFELDPKTHETPRFWLKICVSWKFRGFYIDFVFFFSGIKNCVTWGMTVFRIESIYEVQYYDPTFQPPWSLNWATSRYVRGTLGHAELTLGLSPSILSICLRNLWNLETFNFVLQFIHWVFSSWKDLLL